MSRDPELSVRRHQRYACDAPVELRLAEASRAAVRFSASAPVREGVVIARVLDISLGGVELLSPMFLPRACAVLVRLAGGDGPPMDLPARVRRVAMADRGPTYRIGASFESRDASQAARIERAVRAAAAQAGSARRA